MEAIGIVASLVVRVTETTLSVEISGGLLLTSFGMLAIIRVMAVVLKMIVGAVAHREGGRVACTVCKPTPLLVWLLDKHTCLLLSSEVVFGRVDIV